MKPHTWMDQFWHLVAGFAILAPFVLLDGGGGAFLTGFAIGAAREVEQYFGQDSRTLMLRDRILDASMIGWGAWLAWRVLG